MNIICFLVILFYASFADDTAWQNNHYNIRHGRLTYLRDTHFDDINGTKKIRYTRYIGITPMRTSLQEVHKPILEPKTNDTPKVNTEFRVVRIVGNPLETTVRVIPPGRLKPKEPQLVEKTEIQKEPDNEPDTLPKRKPKVNYDDAILMRAHLTGAEDLKFMKKLQRCNDIQIWAAGAYFMDFLVHREKRDTVEEKLKDRKENYTCLLTNLKPLIHNQRYERSVAARKSTLLKFDFKKYVSLETIDALFELIVTNHPAHAEFRSIGSSHEGRDIMALRVNKHKSDKAMVVVGGIQGRDWASVTSVLCVLGYLIQDENEQKAEFFDHLDWYFIPVLNPDGYQHSRFYDRFWTKNRSEQGNCFGVDLASNFGKHWDSNPIIEPTKNSCSDDYPGTAAFSEKETRALRDFIEILLKSETVVGFVDVQAYGQTITFPWGGIKKNSPHWDMHRTYAQGMRQNIYSQTQMHYTFGPSYDIPYPRSGLSIDWAYSKGINHSYIIETRDKSEFGYLLPHGEIKATGTDIVQALKSLAKRITQN